METLIVPVGRLHEPVAFELETYSEFQRNRIREIASTDSFDFACTQTHDTDDRGRVRRPGPVMFLWIDKDDVLHAERLGRKRILWHNNV